MIWGKSGIVIMIAKSKRIKLGGFVHIAYIAHIAPRRTYKTPKQRD